MKEVLLMAVNMDKENTYLIMDAFMMVIGRLIVEVEKGS